MGRPDEDGAVMIFRKFTGPWKVPPTDLQIAEGEVHLWRIDLGRELPKDAESALLPDEIRRGERFRFERDRHSFLLSTYALREILSRYIGKEPAEVPISVSAKGKPHLSGAGAMHGMHFSLSHTSGVAAVAVARRRVGVDVERMAEDYPHMEVAEGFFARGEVEALRAEAEPSRRRRLFFSYWTRKEAVLKAAGEGLYEDLSTIDLSRGGGVVEYGGSRWSVVELDPEGNLLCSVVLEGLMSGIERYAWEPPQIP